MTLMKINRGTFRYLTAAALLFFGMSATAQPKGGPHSVEGAWQISITLPNGFPYCGPAGALATHDGLVIAESCYASEGAGYGVWERKENGQFAITFIGNSFGPDGTVAGRYRVRATVTLSADGNSVSGQYNTDFFDNAGNPAGSISGALSGVRVQLALLNGSRSVAGDRTV
jgi:hypothetical protein